MGRLNLGYSRYQFQDSTVDYYYSTIGMSRALSKKWNLLIDAGGSLARSKLERAVNEQKTERQRGWVGQGTLAYKGEKTTGELTLGHRVMPAVGRTGVAERTSLTINVKHRFTYELSGRLSAGYYINKSEMGKFSTVPIDEATFRVNPIIRYEFSKKMALEASYSYAFIKDKQQHTEAKRNLFMINFVIQYPLFE
jgi:predicted porin